MKRLLNKAIALALLATTWVGCNQEEWIADYNTGQESESDIQISLNLNVPDPIQVTSRAVTEGINNFTVLCFDEKGLALVKDTATFSATGAESGTLTVTIPNATRVMHVFANQEDVPFEKGMSEKDTRLTRLAATTDQMVYWGRLQMPAEIASLSASAIKSWWATAEKSIDLLRSHAKIKVVNNNKSEFELLGYTVVYTNGSGLAIPYDTARNAYPTVNEWVKTNNIHAPAINNDADLVSGTEETMETSDSIYVYETLASQEKPASIIIKGYNTDTPDSIKYWRVAFADGKGNQVNIRRNHCYTVSIEGHILYGNTTFPAAVADTTSANSVTIAPEVTAIKDSRFSMTVENTSYVLSDGTDTLKFNFQIGEVGTIAFNRNNLSVKWADGQQVSTSNDVNYTFQLDTINGRPTFIATVEVLLKRLEAGESRLEGTINITYTHGNGKILERNVNMVIIPQQKLTIQSYNGVTAPIETILATKPGESDTLVYEISVNKADYEKDKYTINGAPIDRLKFSLPTDFPTGLLPLNVLVSTTDFNVVNSPLIFDGDGGYLKKEIGPGYKYVYPINAIMSEYEIELRYINNLLADKVELTLEAANFEPVKLIINYTTTK